MGNSLNIELKGKYVVLDKKHYAGETDVERMFLCRDGFGCSPDTNGRAVFGHFTIDAEECRVDGYTIKRLAKPEEIAQAKFPQPMTELQKLEKEKAKLQKVQEELTQRITSVEERIQKLTQKESA